jgi:hypothetical protein
MKKLSKAQTALVESLKNATDCETLKEATSLYFTNIKELGGVVVSAQHSGSAFKKTVEVLESLGVIEVRRVRYECEYINPNTGAVQTFSELYKAGADIRKAESTNNRMTEIPRDSNYWDGYYLINLKKLG